MRRYWMILLGAAIGLVGGAALVLFRAPVYTSRASLALRPSSVSEHDVPGQSALDLPTFAPRVTQICTSRAVLSSFVRAYNLYPADINRRPMEDVIDDMRKDIQIQSGSNSVEIAFSYTGDRFTAQKITSELLNQFMNNMIREESQTAHGTAELLQDSADRAAEHWAKLREAASGKTDERLLLDRDLARKQYIELSARVADNQLLSEFKKRRLGTAIEVVDPPTLPQTPNGSPVKTVALSTLAGLVIGVLAYIFTRFRFKQLELAPFSIN